MKLTIESQIINIGLYKNLSIDSLKRTIKGVEDIFEKYNNGKYLSRDDIINVSSYLEALENTSNYKKIKELISDDALLNYKNGLRFLEKKYMPNYNRNKNIDIQSLKEPIMHRTGIDEIKRYIKEEYKKFKIENAPPLLNEEFTYEDYYESFRNLTNSVVFDFLFDNNEDYTKRIPWITVPFNMLKRLWDDYMRFGYVSDNNLNLLDKVERRIYRNIILLGVLTYLAGHTTDSPDENLDEVFENYINNYIRWRLQKPFDKNQLQIDFEKGNGYGKIPKDTNYYPDNNEKNLFQFLDKVLEEKGMLDDEYFKNHLTEITQTLKGVLLERFYDYYIIDKDGHTIISDYGLEPLNKLLYKLGNEDDPNKKIPILDQILNVAHMRSDLAGWLVEGGQHALSELSGYGDIGDEK